MTSTGRASGHGGSRTRAGHGHGRDYAASQRPTIARGAKGEPTITTVTAVADRLREAILRGDFAPKQRLVEVELCEQFDASRFTVRSALRDLAGQGLIELQRNRGARIREITLAEAVEITQVRMVVEGLVAARAAELATDDDADELAAIGQDMRDAVAGGEPLRYSDLNARLHAKLRDISEHGTARRIIEELRGQMVRHQFQIALQPGRSSVSLKQHEAIIAAVVARDPIAAESAMRAHIASVMDALQHGG